MGRKSRPHTATSDMQVTPPYGRKRRGAEESVNEESEKAGLKLNIQKTKIMASDPTISWQKSHHFMGKSGNGDRFYFLGLQNHYGW